MNAGILCYIFYMPVMILCIIVTTMMFFRLRVTNTIVSLSILNIIGILWLFLGVIENLLKDGGERIIGVKMTLLPIFIMPAFVLTFAILHTDILKAKKKGKFYLFFLPSLFFWSPLLFDKYTNLVISHPNSYDPIYPEFGRFYWLNFTLSCIYIIASLIIITIKTVKEKSKRKNLLLIGAIVTPFLATIIPHILTDIHIITPPFDLTPLFFTVFLLLISIGIHYYDLFEFMPYGKEFFNQVKEASIIIDEYDNIINCNASAYNIFGINTSKKHVSSFLSETELKDISGDTFTINKLYEIYNNPKVFGLVYQNYKYFNLCINTIKNKKGNISIRVLTFYDVTDVFLLQEEINEKKRIEQIYDIGANLHDDLCSDILRTHAFVENLTLKINIKCSMHNTFDVILDKVNYIYEKMREYSHSLKNNKDISNILNVIYHPDLDADVELIQFIEAVLMKESNSVENIELSFSHNDIDELYIKPSSCSPLYNIIRESITNSIKHGRANLIEFILSVVDDCIKLIVKDNGFGQSHQTELKSIEHRISQLNGYFEQIPGNGSGFSFNFHIPYKLT